MEEREDHRGFTLLELLIALAISGILSAIAVPEYQNYRKRAYDIRAENELRNVAIAQEAYYIDHEAYLSCSNVECTKLPGISAISAGVHIAIEVNNDGFTGTARHERGSGRIYHWDSEQGGVID